MRKSYLPFEVLCFIFRYPWLLESSSLLHDQLFVAATHDLPSYTEYHPEFTLPQAKPLFLS